jgi:transcriptional regulator with XRE-family HTH domain
MRGMNQIELAKASGVAQNTISEIEIGKRQARPATLKKLADALGVEIADFFEEADSPKGIAPTSQQPSFFNHLREQEREEERRLTDQEIKALTRHLAYVERRLDEDSMTREEADDQLDVLRIHWRTARDAHSIELMDRVIALTQRVFDKAKELKARRVAAAEGVLKDMREWRAQRAS